MKKNLGIITLILMVLMIPISSYVSARDKDAISKIFRIGAIRENPDQGIKHFGPMANYIANKLKEFNVEGGKVVVEKNVNGMMKQIKNGEVEMVLETPFSILKMEEKVGLRPTMLAFKKGTKEYRTLFFVRKDSPIENLTDLRGKTIVFQDPGSTSGYAIPRAELVINGMALSPKEAEKVPADVVRYVFAKDEVNQAFWVIQKRADAGAFNNNDWDNLAEKVRDELKIIHETKPVLRLLVAFGPHLPTRFSNAVEDILLNMNKDPEGKKALKSASKILKIESLTDDDRLSLRYSRDLMKVIDE